LGLFSGQGLLGHNDHSIISADEEDDFAFSLVRVQEYLYDGVICLLLRGAVPKRFWYARYSWTTRDKAVRMTLAMSIVLVAMPSRD
jgi:hypothetical protein